MNITETAHFFQNTLSQNPKKVRLVAISKGQPIQAIKEAFSAGISDFGENYWQEMRLKIKALSNLPICWHFVGSIQSNKTSEIAKQVDWVHSIEREKIAQLLSQHRPSELSALNICIQVNLDRESNKAGVSPEEVFSLVQKIHTLPRLTLRGLMAIPKPQKEEKKQFESFMHLFTLQELINQKYNLSLDTLSMGMTEDYKAALRAGSTLIRIGRGIFGERLGENTL